MKIEITLVPGMEEKIRRLGSASYAADEEDTLEELVSLMLPDLIDNALAGDILPERIDFGDERPDPQRGEEPVDLAGVIEEATNRVEQADISTVLEVGEAQESATEQDTALTMDMLNGQVYPGAYSWASGDPVREKALIEVCTNMPRNMWRWEKVQQLAIRTYDMRNKE